MTVARSCGEAEAEAEAPAAAAPAENIKEELEELEEAATNARQCSPEAPNSAAAEAKSVPRSATLSPAFQEAARNQAAVSVEAAAAAAAARAAAVPTMGWPPPPPRPGLRVAPRVA